jgi:hypothetical protein
MTNNEQEDLPIEEVKLDLDKVSSLIPQYSSEKLCEMIVCDRYFGINKEITVMCMQELARRRIVGETFQFEQYIQDSLDKLPPLNFNMPDLRATLTQLVKPVKK